MHNVCINVYKFLPFFIVITRFFALNLKYTYNWAAVVVKYVLLTYELKKIAIGFDKEL